MSRWPFLLPLLLAACQNKSVEKEALPFGVNPQSAANSGGRRLGQYFKKLAPDPLPTIKTGTGFTEAVGRSIDFLRKNKKSPRTRLAPGIEERDLLTVLYSMQGAALLTPLFLGENFEFYQINTRQEDDMVQFTGYFTPIMEASANRSGRFATPVYRCPEGELPSRSAIKKGALSGKKLEVGWLRSEAELRSIQMQGSCYLHFPDGRVQLIGWDGTNRSGRDEADERGRDEFNYVFFKPMKTAPTGAMVEELTEAVSLSVDPDVVPLGACLLVEMKAPDGTSQFHLMLAQDVGGGIQGTHRFDLYCGMGQPFSLAARVNDYAKVWLVMPKAK